MSQPIKFPKKINIGSRDYKRSVIIKKLDKIVSDRVRERDKWTCQRCKKAYTPPTNALHCSHYYSRRYLGTRWELKNLIALCYGCHRLYESDKQGEYSKVMLTRLGSNAMLLLEAQAYTVTKYSTQELNLLYNEFKLGV